MGTRVIIVRISVMIIMLMASFALGWYLTNRYNELRSGKIVVLGREEVNNPRLNRVLLDTLTQDFTQRKHYDPSAGINVNISEADPFTE